MQKDSASPTDRVVDALSIPPRVKSYGDSHGWDWRTVYDFAIEWTSDRIAFPVVPWSDDDAVGYWERRLVDQPRWLPQGEDFEAARWVFGLQVTHRTIARSNLVLLVESPSCVVALASIGFPIAVATCGDRISIQQAMQVRRWASRAVIWADEGTGGQIMAAKTSQALRDLDASVEKTFVWGPDPASTISRHPDRVADTLMKLVNDLGPGRET
jgi:DNA primase